MNKWMMGILTAFLFFSCNTNTGKVETNVEVKKSPEKTVNAKLSGKILEVLEVDKYTYVRIKNTANEELWVAGPKEQVKIGDTVQIAGGMLMKDFVSKTLNRTFKRIYFVSSLTGKSKGKFHGNSYHGGGSYHNAEKKGDGAKYHQTADATQKDMKQHDAMNKRLKEELSKKYEIKDIKKAEGGYTIEELYQKKADLKGKKVKVRGVVVKFSPEIMNRNWVHLRDGSGQTNNNDLTITTNQKVKLGETVLFEGVMDMDKDFGYGYKYDVILEKSQLLK